MLKFPLAIIASGEDPSDLKRTYGGWSDLQLTRKGVDDTIRAGKKLKDTRYTFDVVFTSILSRGVQTANIVLQQLRMKRTLYKSWQLNPRHCGAYTAMTMGKVFDGWDMDPMTEWMDRFDASPPIITKKNKLFLRLMKMPYRTGGPTMQELPLCESLRFTYLRTVNFWRSVIQPQIRNGKRVLIVSHQDCLQVLMKDLLDLSDEEVMVIDVPRSVPILLELTDDMKIETEVQLT